MVDRVRRVLVNPRFWLWFHAVNVCRWLILSVPGMLLWRESVPFLMFVSLDTVLTGSLCGFGTALAACKADPGDPL